MHKIILLKYQLVVICFMHFIVLASEGKASPGEIVTAVDLVILLDEGKDESDIALLLSYQRGYDVSAAAKRGVTDEQLIDYLLNYRRYSGNSSDAGDAVYHKSNGDEAYAKADYGRAVHEYSLAIEHTAESYEAYKARGDAYGKYLFSPGFPRFTGYTGSSLLKTRDCAKSIVCDAMYSDYSKAETILNSKLNALNSDLYMLKYNMGNEKTIFRVNNDVKPYYGKSAQKTVDMMQYRQLNQLQRNAMLQKSELAKAVSSRMAACESSEYSAHRDRIKAALERTRDPNWIKYGDTGEARYYYDKASVKPLKGFVLATTRRERTGDNYQFETASVKLNCKKHTLDQVERIGYEDIAGVAVTSSNTVPERDLAGASTATDQLARKLCR